MCWEVLNDQWASHPTWASEDSGFVGHKKNQYEEMLHRIEEERHDYDFNIEANLRTIQLLEPIAQRIASMSQEEQENFKLGPGLGGQSRTIYQRVIKKVYDKELGLEIIKEMHERPALVVPIVLRRLKQKDEEWRLAQVCNTVTIVLQRGCKTNMIQNSANGTKSGASKRPRYSTKVSTTKASVSKAMISDSSPISTLSPRFKVSITKRRSNRRKWMSLLTRHISLNIASQTLMF